MASPAPREYDAFSKVATDTTVTVGDKENMPIMIADHSVIYLPMKDGNPYVIFSMADIFNDRKGINDGSIFNYQPGAETGAVNIPDTEIQKIKAMDGRIYGKLIDTIKQNIEDDDEQLFSVKVGDDGVSQSVEEVFAEEGWQSKLTYNFAGSFYDYQKATDFKENKEKVKVFIKATIQICKTEIEEVLEKVDHLYLKSKLNNILNELNTNLNDAGLNDQVESVKNQILKGNTREIGTARGYYIFQPPGNLIKQQPFGGFVFPADLDDIYKSRENFTVFLNKLRYDPTTSRVFATEVVDGPKEITNRGIEKGGVNMTEQDDNEKKTLNEEYLWHGGSDGPKFTELQTITKKPGFKILLSDTNMTEKKSKDKDHNGTFQDISEKLKEEVPGLYVLSSNFKIKKSRMGGPFYNTQIYKSETSTAPPEIDGMVIIFSKEILLNVDISALKQLINPDVGEKYYILHKDGVEVTSKTIDKEVKEAIEKRTRAPFITAAAAQARPVRIGWGGARRRRNRKSRKNKVKKSRKARSRSGNSARKSKRGRGRRTRRN
jgi:hypothetical protein